MHLHSLEEEKLNLADTFRRFNLWSAGSKAKTKGTIPERKGPGTSTVPEVMVLRSLTFRSTFNHVHRQRPNHSSGN